MSTAPKPSVFAHIEAAPRDPVLGITEAYNADTSPRRVNLGVGVYTDDTGRLPLLDCIRQAEAQLVEKQQPYGYLPIDGLPVFDQSVGAVVFGDDCAALREGRTLTVQSLGGTGALKLGADFLRRFLPDARVWISNPSWENHRAIFEGAGFEVKTYPYLGEGNRVDFAGMMACLSGLPAGEVVVLHACCHNPTGLDLTPDQWREVVSVVRGRGLVPFLDMAYQGFAAGLAEDGAAVTAFAATEGPLLVANSFSKSMSLYGERVGALSVVAADAQEKARLLSQLKRVARTTYSSPPTHGAKLVSTVLGTPALRALWEQELAGMRDRIKAMRAVLAERLTARVPGRDFGFIAQQNGMFSYSGLPVSVVHTLRDDFSIYALDSGRICVAALNSGNVDYVVDSIATALTR